MTHKERILEMLEKAGPRGISSKVLYREFMGRGAARIGELRAEGHRIDSEERDPSDPKFCVYRLLSGVGIGGESGTARDVDAVALGHSSDSGGSPTHDPEASLASGSTAPGTGEPPALFEESAFERMRDAA